MDNNGRIIVQLIDCNNKHECLAMCLFHLEVTARITWLSKSQRRRTNLGKWNQSWAGGRAGSSPLYRNCEMPGWCMGRTDLCTEDIKRSFVPLKTF